MSNPRDRSSGPPVDSDAFQEWVEHTAETRGVDEQELLNQLVSAFWILDEMNGISEGEQSIGDMRPLYPPDDVSESDPSTADSSAPKQEADASQSNDNTRPDRPDTGTEEAPADTYTSTETTEESDDVSASSVTNELRALQESMYGQFEVIQTVVELRRQVSDLSLDIEQQRSQQDQFTDRISDELTRLHDRIETLDNRLDEAGGVDEAELDQISEELAAEIDRLDSTQQEFEAWVDEEFDEIEALFQHLINETDTLEARIDELGAEISAFGGDDDPAASRLASIRRDALALGTDTGRCERCETTIDLSMLDEPMCPECDAPLLTAESANSWNPFAKPWLRTGGPDPTSSSEPDSSHD